MKSSGVYKYSLIIFLQISTVASQSPCPNVFQYQYDSTNNLVGLIQVRVSNNYGGSIRLDVQISIENHVKQYHGNIELVTPQSQVLNNIRRNRPLLYKVHFPYWTNIPPAVTNIAVNSNQICYGRPIDRNQAPVVTEIHLQHMINTFQRPQGNSLQYPNFSNRHLEKPNFASYNFPPGSQNEPQDFLNSQHSGNQFNNNNKNNDFVYTFGNIFQHSNNVNIIVDKPPVGNNYQNNGFVYTFGNPSKFSPPSKTELYPTTHKPVESSIPTSTYKPLEIDIRTKPSVGTNTNSGQRPFSDICGTFARSTSLVVNGNPVPKNSHPWLAAVFKQNDNGLRFICGSSLISHKHVITAAHCVRSSIKKLSPHEIWIILGRKNIRRWSSDGSQTLQAESIYIHPDYVPNKSDADIAIVILVEEVTFSSLIRPACLWTGDRNVKLVINKIGTVVGWGKDESGLDYTPEPKQFDFLVVSEEDCLRSNPAFIGIVSNRTFCGGYRNNTGPCTGDSGSGFYMNVNGRWTLRGMVSTSLLRDNDFNCDLEEYVVYTDVVQLTDWVLSYL